MLESRTSFQLLANTSKHIFATSLHPTFHDATRIAATSDQGEEPTMTKSLLSDDAASQACGYWGLNCIDLGKQRSR